jgi:GNAT superfamily N-acetyltransferase
VISVLSVVIRKATADDSAAILEVLRAAFAPYESRYTPAGYEDTVLTLDTLRDRFKTMTIFVAEDREVIGTIACSAKGDEGHLRGMAVRPDRLGTGVARELLQAAEAELRAKNCKRVTLDTTDPLKRAMRFYEKNGYRRSGRVTDFFGMALYEYVKVF